MQASDFTNGTHQPGAPNGKPEMYALRVFRIEEGMNVFMRMLSPEYGGLFTHYYRGRSVICLGKDCANVMHKVDRYWKGYAAAEWYNVATKKWHPTCLEITENLELSLRGLYARGQVWQLWREPPVKKKAMPVEGKLHEELDQARLPRPFDLVPCLRALYHTDILDLSHKNPLPGRVYVTHTEDAPPEMLRQQIEKQEENKRIFEEQARASREAAEKRRSPATNNPFKPKSIP